jgi:S-adenosylmethionine decarboxylase
MPLVGSHHLLDLHGVDAATLRDEARLMALFAAALEAGGFHVVGELSHRFPDGGQGVTGVFLLSESHLAFHTYPEHAYLALDLFSCGSARPDAALRHVQDALRPAAVDAVRRDRGKARPPRLATTA